MGTNSILDREKQGAVDTVLKITNLLMKIGLAFKDNIYACFSCLTGITSRNGLKALKCSRSYNHHLSPIWH